MAMALTAFGLSPPAKAKRALLRAVGFGLRKQGCPVRARMPVRQKQLARHVLAGSGCREFRGARNRPGSKRGAAEEMLRPSLSESAPRTLAGANRRQRSRSFEASGTPLPTSEYGTGPFVCQIPECSLFERRQQTPTTRILGPTWPSGPSAPFADWSRTGCSARHPPGATPSSGFVRSCRSVGRTGCSDGQEKPAPLPPSRFGTNTGQVSRSTAKQEELNERKGGRDDCNIRLAETSHAWRGSCKTTSSMSVRMGDWGGLSGTVAFPCGILRLNPTLDGAQGMRPFPLQAFNSAIGADCEHSSRSA